MTTTVPGRIDYYDDPAAPEPTSLVPSVNVVVTNEAGEILLVRRGDNDNWALPGGAMELGESIAQAAVREVREETGVGCEITGLVGIYTDPGHVIVYTSDGEARQEFSVVFRARVLGGQLTPSDETPEVRWVLAAAIAGYRIDPTMRRRIRHHLNGQDSPRIC